MRQAEMRIDPTVYTSASLHYGNALCRMQKMHFLSNNYFSILELFYEMIDFSTEQ